MRAVRQQGTSPELALRTALDELGIPYRENMRIAVDLKTTADLAFPDSHLAVFIDGCFWHGCPQHATWPKHNSEFWRSKIAANQSRDMRNRAELERRGWQVKRFWAHEDPHAIALELAAIMSHYPLPLSPGATHP